jgi:arylsulfatase A-like enzyme
VSARGTREVCFVLALLLAAGCPSATPRAPSVVLEDVNVVLIVIDTLAAKHVGYIAGGESVTPAIDSLAARGVAFTGALAPAPWTQPSIGSLLTGRMPSAHGAIHLFDVLAPGPQYLPSFLSSRGFSTGLVVSHELLMRRFGWDQGFDFVDETAVGGHSAITSEKVTDTAIGFLRGHTKNRFFLMAHYFDPHYVYNHHPSYDQTAWYRGTLRPAMGIWDLLDLRPKLTADDVRYIAGLYREEVHFTDAQVGRLLGELSRLGLENSTLVVLVADHGEEFMEHGWIGHTKHLYDEALRVPFVVSLPGRIDPRRVEGPVSLLDLFPTLSALSRQPAENPAFAGVSLVPALLRGEQPDPERLLISEVSFGLQPGDPPRYVEKMAFKTAAMRRGHKVIHDIPSGRWELYERKDDPGEKRNLASTGGEEEQELRAALIAFEKARGDAASPNGSNSRTLPTPEEIEKLRALGYIR